MPRKPRSTGFAVTAEECVYYKQPVRCWKNAEGTILIDGGDFNDARLQLMIRNPDIEAADGVK